MPIKQKYLKNIIIIPVIVLTGCNLPSNMIDRYKTQQTSEEVCKEMQRKGQFPKGQEYYVEPDGDVYSSNPVIGCYYKGTIDKEVEQEAEGYGGRALFLLKLEGGHLIRYIKPVGQSDVIREQMSNKQIKEIVRN